MAHLQNLKWPIAVRRTFILILYGVSGVLIEYSAHNCRYFDFRLFETLMLVILRLFINLRTQIQQMGHLQHLKWPMDVRRPFLLRLYDVSGVLIGLIHVNLYYYQKYMPPPIKILGGGHHIHYSSCLEGCMRIEKNIGFDPKSGRKGGT